MGASVDIEPAVAPAAGTSQPALLRSVFSRPGVSAVEPTAGFAEMVERAYEHGRGLNVASHFEIDDVIDPAESRRWIAAAMAGHVPRPGGRPCVDPW